MSNGQLIADVTNSTVVPAGAGAAVNMSEIAANAQGALQSGGDASGLTITPPGQSKGSLATYLASALGNVLPKNVFSRAPGATDDSAHGYAVGNSWLRPDGVYQCTQSVAGNAVWLKNPYAALLPMDAVSAVAGGAGPVLAIGTRKLAAAYAGPAINVGSDIAFLTNGAMDEAALAKVEAGTAARVPTAYDQSGNAYNVTAAAGSQPCTTPLNKVGNARGIVFDSQPGLAPDAATKMAIPAGMTITGNAFTVIMLMRAFGSHMNLFPIEFSSAGGHPVFAGWATSSTPPGWKFQQNASNFINLPAGVGSRGFPKCNAQVVAFTFTAGAYQAIINDMLYSGAPGSYANTSYAGGYVGGSVTGGADGGMEIGALMVYNRALSQAELLAATASLYNTFQVAPQARDQWVVMGDSITYGTASSYGLTYGRQAEDYLQTPLDVIVDGHFGQTTVLLNGELAGEFSLIRNPSVARSIYTVFAGTNDMAGAGGATDVVTEANYQTLCQNVKAFGPNVLVGAVTMLPADAPHFTVTQQQYQVNFNTWLRANWHTFADFLIDVAADPLMGNQATTDNATYYNGALHPTGPGISIEAQIFANAINALPPWVS